MIALPPRAIEQCVEGSSSAARAARPIWDVAGPPALVDELLRLTKAGDWAEVALDEMRSGERHVALRQKPGATYRAIGGFVYRAQTLSIDFTSRFDPPICGMDQN